jgi:excinuclease ABC subunit A
MLANRSSFAVRGPITSNIDVTLPAGKLAIITGVSGSGKSSLAFDTIYAEGQAQVRRVAVGLCSAVSRADGEARRRPHRRHLPGDCHPAEEQCSESPLDRRNNHEIHDYMRLLFARVGRTFCRQCGQEVIRETAEVVAKRPWRVA